MEMKFKWSVSSEGYLEVRFEDGSLLAGTSVHIGRALIESNQTAEIDFSSIPRPKTHTKHDVIDKIRTGGKEEWKKLANSPEGRQIISDAAKTFIKNKPTIFYLKTGLNVYPKEKSYTRKEIQELVGGEIQTYLPQKDKIVLAGCFNRELNPDCPKEILAGKAGKVVEKAELLMSQPNTVFPVFVKEFKDEKEYSFVGWFRCIGGTNDADTIARAELRSGRNSKISYVIRLEQFD